MIDNKTRNCKVTIFGESYSLITSESEEHVVQAAHQVDLIIKEIAHKSTNNIDEKKCAVLTALRFASKVLLLEAEVNKRRQKEGLLIEAIDRELEAGSQPNH